MPGSFGWVRDIPDDRDHPYVAPPEILRNSPGKADLRSHFPPAYNQHLINYNERAMEGTLGKDGGARIRDGIKTIAKQGDCPEKLWPYYKRNLNVRPPEECYLQARHYKVSR